MTTLWKDKYKTGNNAVDQQHMELFDITERLLKTIRYKDSKAKKEESIKTVQALKNYSIEHFSAEEDYMESIKYKDLNTHKKLHETFIDSVLEAEQKMIKADYDMPSVKEFTGFLTAWLTYHVAGADQQIKTNEKITDGFTADDDSYIDYFAQSIRNLLTTMFDQADGNVNYVSYVPDKSAVLVSVNMEGDFEGEAILAFPRKTVSNFVKALTFMELDEIDEMTYSVLSEITNIVCGNVASLISSRGMACDIRTPQLIPETHQMDNYDTFCFETNKGPINVALNIA